MFKRNKTFIFIWITNLYYRKKNKNRNRFFLDKNHFSVIELFRKKRSFLDVHFINITSLYSNSSAYGLTNRPDLSFHRIPSESKNKELRKQWLYNIRRTGTLPKDPLICSSHFEDGCFIRDLHDLRSKFNQLEHGVN